MGSFAFFALIVSTVLAGTTTTAPTSPAQCGTILTIGRCLTVTEAASFVDCNSTINRCYCLPTFDGNASPANKCRCNAPKQVIFPSTPLGGGILSDSNWVPANWGFEDPVCVDLVGLVTEAAKQAKHKASVITFFNNTIFPTPFLILQSGGLSLKNTLVASNVRARLSPAGAFDEFEGVIEYFYGFVANPGFSVRSVDYVSIAATGNTVAAKVNLFIQNDNWERTASHPPLFFNISLFSFFTFNNQDLIQSIDISCPNLGKLLDIEDPALRNQIIIFTCTVLTQPTPLTNNRVGGSCGFKNVFLGGTNYTAQYENCIAVMQSKPYGSRDRMNADNFVCRQVHSLLTPYGPDIHCPHTSQSGGGACIEFSYDSFFQKNY